MLKTVSIIGLGYIGLPTAAVLSGAGVIVNGYDINQDVVASVNSGRSHIVEPGLNELIKKTVGQGKLRAHISLQPADVYMICVPTPIIKTPNGISANLEFVFAAVADIAKILKAGDLVLLESTCPVGTTEKVENLLYDQGIEQDCFHLAYCPERIIPGKALIELIENDRVVGGINTLSSNIAKSFYEKYVSGTVYTTDSATAELCKLTENSFRDLNIAFANELSVICDKNNINPWELIELANKHPRVNILSPGTGVGGHCISVDPWFIVSQNREDARIIATARHVNDEKPKWVIKKIEDALEGKSKGSKESKVALFGLSFKPDIDDLRDSPAITVYESLREAGIDVMAVEPNITEIENIKLVNVETALSEATVLAVLVRHKEFMESECKKLLINNNALDFCGLFVN